MSFIVRRNLNIAFLLLIFTATSGKLFAQCHPQTANCVVSGTDPEPIGNVVSGTDPEPIGNVVSGTDPEPIGNVVSGTDPEPIGNAVSDDASDDDFLFALLVFYGLA